MEKKSEVAFSGKAINGFLMLFVNLAVLILAIVGIVYSIILLDENNGLGGWLRSHPFQQVEQGRHGP